jgi:hypothetical protein
MIGGGGSAGEVAGERRRRRSSSGAATGTHTAVKTGTGLKHVLHGKLPCGPGKMLGRCLGLEDRRRGELGGGGLAAAAGARTPAIVGLGLINKRLGELLGCTRKGSGACGGEGVDWREVRTGGANGGTAVAQADARAREELPRAGLYARGRSVGGRWGHTSATCMCGEVGGMASDVRRSGGQRRATGGAPADG